jgi:hypothetical protein
MNTAEHARAAADLADQALTGLPDPSDDSHTDRFKRSLVLATVALVHALRSVQQEPSGIPKGIGRSGLPR